MGGGRGKETNVEAISQYLLSLSFFELFSLMTVPWSLGSMLTSITWLIVFLEILLSSSTSTTQSSSVAPRCSPSSLTPGVCRHLSYFYSIQGIWRTEYWAGLHAPALLRREGIRGLARWLPILGTSSRKPWFIK